MILLRLDSLRRITEDRRDTLHLRQLHVKELRTYAVLKKEHSNTTRVVRKVKNVLPYKDIY